MNKAPPQNPSTPLEENDARLDSAAFHRNCEPIWDVLSPWLHDKSGNVLEVGSGSGQHVVEFARRSPHLLWWPSDLHPRNIESIDAWRQHAQAQNIEVARRIDLSAQNWGLSEADSATLSDLTAIFCANVLHISPWQTTEGLMRGAAGRLHPGGRLFIYGPFKQDGQHTAPSNEAFDASLRARDPQWGIRDINDIRDEAHKYHLVLADIAAMPANNMILIFECAQDDTVSRKSDWADDRRYSNLLPQKQTVSPADERYTDLTRIFRPPPRRYRCQTHSSRPASHIGLSCLVGGTDT